MTYTLWHGDCLEEMSRIEAGSVDAVICDLPFGKTANKWDIIIPFEPLWREYKRVVKRNGPIVLFGSQPFTSLLVVSNLAWFKWADVWDKVMVSNIANAKRQPLRSHEDILIFCSGQPVYNPQSTGKAKRPFGKLSPTKSKVVGKLGVNRQVGVGYPKSILRYPRPNNLSGGGLHPNQKPVPLLENLVKTYTNEGETVLDSTCGSGSTLEAAMRCNRHSIGIEKDTHYYQVASDRLARVAAELRGELNHLPMFEALT